MNARVPTVRVRGGYIAGAGARIYYKTLGRGLPLLVLHGGPGADHTDFLPALKPLARRCQLVLIDERGSGRSERLSDPKRYTLDWMVKDIERVRKHLRLPQLLVLGHSFGGILAQAYAVRHPGRILGLVLAGTGSSARCVERDFRRIRKRLPASLSARLARHEKAGIFQADGAYTARVTLRPAHGLSLLICTQKLRRRDSSIRRRPAWKSCGKCGCAARTFASTGI